MSKKQPVTSCLPIIPDVQVTVKSQSLQRSQVWLNLPLLIATLVEVGILLFAALLNPELSAWELVARVGTLSTLFLALTLFMPFNLIGKPAVRLLDWLYVAAMFPFALYYLWLPGYNGAFPIADFFVNYGVQMTYSLILTIGIVGVWKAPQMWQRWSLTVGVMAFGVWFANFLVAWLP